MNPALFESRLTSLPLLSRGKVRDIYEIDAERLLIVTTDRLSAFDVVMSEPIPGKGSVLAAMANFWFERLALIIPNHLTGEDPRRFVTAEEAQHIDGRAIVVRRYTPLPVEAIVRGYLVGSGWKDYQRSGAVCGIALPAGLAEAEQLPYPIFTPSTKASGGAHDANISFTQAETLLGADLAARVRDTSIALYQAARDYAISKGIIIADTKFEFGTDEEGELFLIDEALTPDSSRFWPADQYAIGKNPPSFDKQFVRDYLESVDWNKTPPAPPLPDEIIAMTAQKYEEVFRRLTAGYTSGRS